MTDGCLFCGIIAGSVDAHRVLEEERVVGFLDVRPVFKGHVLLVPRQHLVTLADLPEDLMVPLFDAAKRVGNAITSGIGAQGTFVAMNNVVSQSVAHLHVHVVPRTKGDGLRGFFWPRTKYTDGEAEQYATKIRDELQHEPG
ncbi:histidine triad (HIT) family protein [Aeromicrobium panaciterrae]|uniref:Histidine triad (HIT) family protein n=1 Tax=Aeromicrobium panaciterrae TaxID=363861 RepID=A0ABU1UQZ9_9ACTN|nr:HIT family protein [Aeromicrobium panaciterrae]MDR7087601.1 histidine triad (HIT) family protein [Aeromicrobium panaciterrae]